VQSSLAVSTSTASFGARQTLANLTVNIGSNISTGISEIDSATSAAIAKVLSALQFSEFSKDILFPGKSFHMPAERVRYHEDTAPNPLHTVIIGAALFAFAFRARNRADTTEILYLASLIAGIIIFVTFLRWQPWITRLQLPLFVIAAPAVATQISRWLQSGKFATTITAVFLLSGLEALFFNATRPLLSSSEASSFLAQTPAERLFANKPAWQSHVAPTTG
jgi:hypothetical protein